MFKIKKEIVEILKPVSSLINDRLLINSENQVPFLPFYHLVEDSDIPYLTGLYEGRSKKQFTRDLDYFLKFFSPIDLDELNQGVLSSFHPKSDKPLVHLSFDDGLLNCSEVIAPLLKEKGISATFFVTKNFAENTSSFYRFDVSRVLYKLDQLNNNQKYTDKIKNILQSKGLWVGNLKSSMLLLNQNHVQTIEEIKQHLNLDKVDQNPFMDMEDIKSLRKDGFTIGAHSVSHPLFSVMTDEEIKVEIIQSLEWVVQNFDMKLKTFAFPFSDDGVSLDLFRWLFEEKGANLDLAFGTAGLKRGYHKNHLQRIPMEMYQAKASRRIKAEYLYSKLRKTVKGDKYLLND